MQYAKTERLDSWRYTVEPGVDECRSKLNPGNNGGGIGSLDSMGTKYYDFYQMKDEPGSLRHFLNTLVPVEDDVTYYCARSYGAIKSYVTNYLSLFVSSSDAKEIVDRIEWHSKTHRHDAEAAFLYRTIAVGTQFFNEILYDTSWTMAQKLFPAPLLSNCTDFLARNRTSQLPTWKVFVNEFDSDCFEFEMSRSNNSVQLAQQQKLIGMPWYIKCSERDYQKSFKPYILFFSNWTLLLLCLLAGEKFGQCAFGIYWETGRLAQRQGGYW